MEGIWVNCGGKILYALSFNIQKGSARIGFVHRDFKESEKNETLYQVPDYLTIEKEKFFNEYGFYDASKNYNFFKRKYDLYCYEIGNGDVKNITWEQLKYFSNEIWELSIDFLIDDILDCFKKKENLINLDAAIINNLDKAILEYINKFGNSTINVSKHGVVVKRINRSKTNKNTP